MCGPNATSKSATTRHEQPTATEIRRSAQRLEKFNGATPERCTPLTSPLPLGWDDDRMMKNGRLRASLASALTIMALAASCADRLTPSRRTGAPVGGAVAGGGGL
jgi:hypothetical protein